MLDSEYRSLEELVRESHEDDSEEYWTSPGDADEFSSSMVPGFDEGEFPPWVQAMNPHPLPPEILQRFGELRTTFVSGDYWHIAPENEHAVVAELRAMGYDVRREPALHCY